MIITLPRGADTSLARPTSPCILFDGESISFDASLVMYVKLKDRKRSLSGKKRPLHVVALEKQPQRKILRCGCFYKILRCGSYSEGSDGFGLKVTCNL